MYMIVYERPAHGCYQLRVSKAVRDVPSYPTKRERGRLVRRVIVAEYEGERVSESYRHLG